MFGWILSHVRRETAGWRRLGLALVLIGGLLVQHGTSLADTITLTGGEKFIQSAYGQWLERVYREAFRRLGLEFRLVGYPSQRAIVMADNGEVDGQVERGHDFVDEHPNLVRVEEPLMAEAYSAFATRPDVLVAGWDSLRNSRLSVVARRGVGKKVESLARLVQPGERLLFIETPEQGLRMLAKGRADLYVDYEPLVLETLQQLRVAEPTTFAAIHKAGELERTTHHAFLHNKHAALAPRLAKVLRDMKREGLVEKYRHP